MGGQGHWAVGCGEHLWAPGHRADALHPANRVLAATLHWAPRLVKSWPLASRSPQSGQLISYPPQLDSRLVREESVLGGGA